MVVCIVAAELHQHASPHVFELERLIPNSHGPP